MIDTRRTIRSAVWSAVEGGGLALVSFVTLLVYTRVLGPADLGAFAVIMASVEMINLVVSMAFHDALIQRKDLPDSAYDTAFTGSIVFSVVISVVYSLCVPALARGIRYEGDQVALLAMAVTFPLAGASSTLVARLRRDLEFRSLAMRSLVGRLAGAVIGIALAFAGARLWSLVAQQLAISLISTLVLWMASSRRPKLGFHLAEFLSLSHFSLKSLIALFSNFALKRVFVIICAIKLGAAATAYLNVAFRTIDTLWSVLATAVQQVALPMLSRLCQDEDRIRVAAAYERAVKISCIVLYPCFLGLGAIAQELVPFLFGARWQSAAPYLTVLSFIALVQIPRMLAGAFFSALGRPQDILPQLASAAILMIIAFTATHAKSPWWGVTVWIACEALITPVAIGMLKHSARITVTSQIRGAIAPTLSSLVMVAAIHYARSVLPATLPSLAVMSVLIAIGATTYGLILFLVDRRALAETLLTFQKALARRGA